MSILFFFFISFLSEQKINLSEHNVFTVYQQIAVSENGVICLVNHSEDEVLLFDGNFSLVKHLKNKGSGPQEYGSIAYIYWDQTLKCFQIQDRGNHRLHQLSEKGELLGSQDFRAARALRPLSDGTYLLAEQFVDNVCVFQLNRCDQNGAQKEVIYEIDLRGQMKQLSFPSPSGKRMMGFITPWDRRVQVAKGSGFLAVNAETPGQLRILDFFGKVKKVINTKMPKILLSENAMDEFLENVPTRHHANMRKHAVLPDYWPVIRKIMVDGQDRIYLFGYEVLGKGHPYEVYSAAGEHLKRGYVATVPDDILGDYFYNVFKDENDDFFLSKTLSPLSDDGNVR